MKSYLIFREPFSQAIKERDLATGDSNVQETKWGAIYAGNEGIKRA